MVVFYNAHCLNICSVIDISKSSLKFSTSTKGIMQENKKLRTYWLCWLPHSDFKSTPNLKMMHIYIKTSAHPCIGIGLFLYI